MQRRLGWCVVFLLYWANVVHFLQSASPVFFDGSGPMPSFYWRTMPSPPIGEYYRHRLHYDLLYLLPYAVAGLIMTMTGLTVSPPLRRRLRPLSSRPLIGTGVVTLVLLLFMASASDAGSLLGYWRSPLFLLYGTFGAYGVFVLSKVFLPAAILSGLVEFGASVYFSVPR